MAVSYAQAKGRAGGSGSTQNAVWKGGTFMKFETFGVPELDKLWKDLTANQQRSIAISTWRKASKPMLAAIKGNTSAMVGKVTGNLYKSIGSSPRRGVAVLDIGARRFNNFKGHHAHLVNDGTAERFHKSGKSTGSVDGSQFFDLAFDATKKQVIEDYRGERIKAFHMFIVRANKRKKTKRLS